MRRVMMATCVFVAGFWSALSAAEAKIAITVDKDIQQMTVSVDGVPKYVWPVSSGNPSHETPNGNFRTFRMEEDHFSKEFDEAPMPHAIFFTRQGHAIHGTDSVNRLGSPASHGCVRLSRANAATLFAMVKADGVLNTTVTLVGSSQVALARDPRPSKRIARQETYGTAYEDVVPADPSRYVYDRPLYPRQMPMQAESGFFSQPRAVERRAPRQMVDDGYVYPSDGGGRYPAPRGYRRMYDSQGNPY